MQRKEKRSGGLNLKRFFKSMTKPSNNDRHHGNGATSPRQLLPSGDNQYAEASRSTHYAYWGPPHSQAATQRSSPKTNYTSNARLVDRNPSSLASAPKTDANILRWGLVLSRIPKLVAESTSLSMGATSPSGSTSSSPTAGLGGSQDGSSSSSSADMFPLLESLRQMAPREYQAQIMQYYMGSSSYSNALTASSGVANINVLSNWEQRKVFKQCRRSLLLCWKCIIAQLNDEKINRNLAAETCDTYYQLLGLIAERVEFNLLPDPKDLSKAGSNNNHSGRPPTAKPRSSSQSGVPSPSSASSTAHGFEGDNNSNSEENGSEGERDIYLYRCLLVATFKHVIESIDAANMKKRSFITFAESQFFAKVLAICFFRVPVVQRMILDSVYEAYRGKKWTRTNPGSTSATSSAPPTPAQLASRLNRRRSSSKPWNGMTFVGTLARWSEFEGQLLQENMEDAGSDGDGKADHSDKLSENAMLEENPNNPFAPPSRVVIEKFKRLNPTLFRWTRYSPYLGPYADSDVFRTHEVSQAGWMLKLTQDGEFFSCFMTSYMQHAELVSIGEPVWYCLPGYALLIRISMLLVKEAAWRRWQSIRDATDNIINSSNQDDEPVAFEVKSSRSVKTVLDGVLQLLKNRDVLESCVLAVFECTNVLNAKSVGACLSRMEEWFGASAVAVGENTAGDIAYRLPVNFHGHALGTGVRVMLSSESFEILNRVLLFLYNRMDYFDGELRQNVLKAIVQRHMFLFLHWNTEVRNSYHHLLVYKIIRTNRYLLDSPIDQLLVGRVAMMPSENAGSNGRDENTSAIGFDDTDGPYDEADNRPVLSVTEFNILRLEQALWRAFDACLAAICVQERRNAREANRRYQIDLQAARSRAVAFQNLSLKALNEYEVNSNNEGLPGGKPSHELDLLNEELNREPPYYLRYLPAEEVSSLDELRRLAQAVKYPAELQLYAAISLRGYSDLLKQYFHDMREHGYAEAPPLGYV